MSECLTSKELAEQIAAFHGKQADVVFQIKTIQGLLPHIAEPEKASKKILLNGLLAQQAFNNEKMKELSVVYKSTIDQILFDVVKHKDKKFFNDCLEEAQRIYDKRITVASN